jgi:hypothetical protein
LKPTGVTAFQFLFEQGIEYSKSGAEAERNGDSFSILRYQRAMAILRPIVYFVRSDGFTLAVRNLFVQLSMRIDDLQAKNKGEI